MALIYPEYSRVLLKDFRVVGLGVTQGLRGLVLGNRVYGLEEIWGFGLFLGVLGANGSHRSLRAWGL